MLPQGGVDAADVVKVVKGGCCGGNLHLAACPRALQQHGEAVGVARSVALSGRRRKVSVERAGWEKHHLITPSTQVGPPVRLEIRRSRTAGSSRCLSRIRLVPFSYRWRNISSGFPALKAFHLQTTGRLFTRIRQSRRPHSVFSRAWTFAV